MADFIKFFKSFFSDPDEPSQEPTLSLDETIKLISDAPLPSDSEQKVKALEPEPDLSVTSASLSELLHTFERPTWSSESSSQLKTNMQALKDIAQQPRDQNVELRFGQVQKYLGPEECHETLRQDRWHGKVTCPKCSSNKVKQIEQEKDKSPHNFRYRCHECQHEFNDDSDTPIEKGSPPLETWMQCWYLMSITSSASYISAKLNLDLALVQEMIQLLQKVFKSEEALSQYNKHKDWSKEASRYEKIIKQEIMAKKDELINAEKADAPKDTSEHRRQRTRRRNPSGQ